ncbi:MAG: YabP/YqfC family sporulation protein [Oscillospiraceae bacterium]|jgi:hypothetical protein|nr:YabP/YqfC family sporulation protein [Oscillospiraceae bacterium]
MDVRWKREFMNWMYLESSLHLHSNRELRLENCRKVLEYHDMRVCLETRELQIEIWGTHLRVFDYNDNNVIVRGRITSLNLKERR